MKMPRVSVVIPHYEDLDRLDACLTALGQQSLGPDQFEIIVADNGSSAGWDEIERVVAGRARLVHAPIKGSGPARNTAVDQARGEILAFTDCDCIPQRDWLSAGMAALQNADFVGGCMTVLVTDRSRMTGAEAFESLFAFNNRRYVEEENFTITANLFCTREVFDAVGPFRARVSEDKEWCLRARDRGFRIGYAPEAVVAHPARPDWAQLQKKWQRLMEESYALMLERGEHRVTWLLRTWALLPSILIHGFRVIFSGEISGTRHRALALATLVRLRLWRFIEGHRLLFKKAS